MSIGSFLKQVTNTNGLKRTVTTVDKSVAQVAHNTAVVGVGLANGVTKPFDPNVALSVGKGANNNAIVTANDIVNTKASQNVKTITSDVGLAVDASGAVLLASTGVGAPAAGAILAGVKVAGMVAAQSSNNKGAIAQANQTFTPAPAVPNVKPTGVPPGPPANVNTAPPPIGVPIPSAAQTKQAVDNAAAQAAQTGVPAGAIPATPQLNFFEKILQDIENIF